VSRWTTTIGLALPLLLAGCDLGPFGGENGAEDHQFLIDLRNTSFDPVTIGVAGEPSGFEVQAISRETIRRQVDPDEDLVFEARVSELAPPVTIACRYHPPSDVFPRRQVRWNGAELDCISWE
jgi:hypothetical protein